MRTSPLVLLILSATVTLSNGCLYLHKNLPVDLESITDIEGGIIVGSVTAPIVRGRNCPPAARYAYQQGVMFRYHTPGNQFTHRGVLTSGTTLDIPLMPWPFCGEDPELNDQCGHLFAVNLPAGKYVMDSVVFEYALDVYQPDTPMEFSVLEGKVIYLGDLHVNYCLIFPGSECGCGSECGPFSQTIIGADISVRDNYERDTRLLREKYRVLRNVPIERHLLPDYAWKWRRSSTCNAASENAPKPTQ